MVSTDCPLLGYGFRSRTAVLHESYEYRYRTVADNGDRPGYTNCSFSTTRLEVEAYNLLQSGLSVYEYIFSCSKASCLFSYKHALIGITAKLYAPHSEVR